MMMYSRYKRDESWYTTLVGKHQPKIKMHLSYKSTQNLVNFINLSRNDLLKHDTMSNPSVYLYPNIYMLMLIYTHGTKQVHLH